AERRTIAARLGAGGAMLVAALDELEDIALRLRLPGWLEVEGGAEWRDAVRRAAGKTEAAWTALEEAAHDEWSRWLAEVERIRAWRRPRWPLWLVTFAVLGLAGYLGLVLGGVIPAPDPLDPLVEAWWRRLG
ncbi:MAG TPA: hypothetical protein VNK43_01325, partial [Gemmatimonadales bacterium]|nr:hypothetical protein [Gemmatimonadales bacterium]